MRVIALRHGQSHYNLRGLCNDDPARRVDLTALGVRQAEAAADRLVAEPIEVIYCSPLLRARRTARIVADRLGLAVTVDDRLADIRTGCDGRPVLEYLQAIARDPVDARIAGGESLRDYQVRVGGFLCWLAAQPWQCSLLVAHEETLRLVAAHCEARDLCDVVGRAYDNCVPYRFQLAGGNRDASCL